MKDALILEYLRLPEAQNNGTLMVNETWNPSIITGSTLNTFPTSTMDMLNVDHEHEWFPLNPHTPHLNDVIFDAKSYGNRLLNEVVVKRKYLYQTSRFRREKHIILKMILNEVRSLKPPGKFLKWDYEACRWYILSDRQAERTVRRMIKDANKSVQKEKINSHSCECFRSRTDFSPKKKNSLSSNEFPPDIKYLDSSIVRKVENEQFKREKNIPQYAPYIENSRNAANYITPLRGTERSFQTEPTETKSISEIDNTVKDFANRPLIEEHFSMLNGSNFCEENTQKTAHTNTVSSKERLSLGPYMYHANEITEVGSSNTTLNTNDVTQQIQVHEILDSIGKSDDSQIIANISFYPSLVDDTSIQEDEFAHLKLNDAMYSNSVSRDDKCSFQEFNEYSHSNTYRSHENICAISIKSSAVELSSISDSSNGTECYTQGSYHVRDDTMKSLSKESSSLQDNRDDHCNVIKEDQTSRNFPEAYFRNGGTKNSMMETKIETSESLKKFYKQHSYSGYESNCEMTPSSSIVCDHSLERLTQNMTQRTNFYSTTSDHQIKSSLTRKVSFCSLQKSRDSFSLPIVYSINIERAPEIERDKTDVCSISHNQQSRFASESTLYSKLSHAEESQQYSLRGNTLTEIGIPEQGRNVLSNGVNL